MTLSIFDLFSIGIGPSSSHTVGPMKAAFVFINTFTEKALTQIDRITIELYGSLAFTGKGHGTDQAILLGLEGNHPTTIDPDTIQPRITNILKEQTLTIRQHAITFNLQKDFLFNFKELLPLHSNGMRFSAYTKENTIVLSKIFYSIGGGFIIDDEVGLANDEPSPIFPFPFRSMRELIAHCEKEQASISQIMLANESILRPTSEVKAELLKIATVMRQCIDKGCQTAGILPGGLNVQRRASALLQKLQAIGRPISFEYTNSIAWLNLYAIAVNEENAAGSRIVTAPTNGAAGVLPAVLHYYLDFYPNVQFKEVIDFLLTAGAFAILYKKGASISGAEVGCQGEVGVASSMAAGALTAALGGTIYQVENAAEIAMEHHLGLTCDPIQGLVQIPCIERNAMGAVKALNASRLALLGNGSHMVSLDKAIATMKQTGKDMMSIYKETSLGGLAANIPDC